MALADAWRERKAAPRRGPSAAARRICAVHGAAWCSKGHIGQILEGVLELEFVDRIVSAKAGDGLFIPAGAEHAHRAVAKTTTVVALFVEDDV